MRKTITILLCVIFIELLYGFMPMILAQAGIDPNVFVPSALSFTGINTDTTEGLPLAKGAFSEYTEETLDKNGFYLRIDKIDLFKRIVKNVDPRDKVKYVDSWNYGISHGMFTSTPDKIGLTYLFSHATGNKEDAVNQNAWFSYMDQLEVGDEVIIYYEGKKYFYNVSEIFAVAPTATGFYTGASPVAKVRMQYCGPPTGSLDSRTLVDAILVSSESL